MGRPWAVPDPGTDRPTPGNCVAKRHPHSPVAIGARGSLITNLDRARLAGSALIASSDNGLVSDSVALAFQMRAIPRKSLKTFVRVLTVEELAELDLATDEAIGRIEPRAETE